MTTSAAGPTAPIFILSHARTGSTLLRYLIDSHPDVCSPPEIALGRLCHALGYTLALTHGEPAGDDAEAVEQRRAIVALLVRKHVDEIMDAYCAAKRKRRWCDKSTHNVEHLSTLSGFFPDAQYVCLHRNAMDVVFSLLELFRFGFPGRYGEAVARSPENIVDAMVDTWTEATERLLAFEARYREQCFRMKYEELVTSPEVVARDMFTFLHLPFDPAMLEAVFKTAHDPGPGDLKIQFTSRILRNRIGKGTQIPRQRISADRLAKLNTLHEALGYPPVRQEGGGSTFHFLLREQSKVSRPVAAKQWG